MATVRGHPLEQAARRRTVAELREDGHSTRAIADAVGVSQTAVQNDLRFLSADFPERIHGLDGKTYPARRAA